MNPVQRILFALCFSLWVYVLQAQPKDGKPLVIAHRGASGHAPENTMASINKALEMGADVIEIDVHQSRDKQVVVMHDSKLDRTTNMAGLIKDYNWDDIKDADAGSWFSGEFTGERIPTLEDVISQIKGKAHLLIEIKKGGDYYPGLEQNVLDIIKDNHSESWCMIQSFSDAAVQIFLDLDSGIEVYKLVIGRAFRSKKNTEQVAGVNPNKMFAKKRNVEKLHERGQKVFVWTVNEEKDMIKLITLGVDGIITNYPDRLKKLLLD